MSCWFWFLNPQKLEEWVGLHFLEIPGMSSSPFLTSKRVMTMVNHSARMSASVSSISTWEATKPHVSRYTWLSLLAFKLANHLATSCECLDVLKNQDAFSKKSVDLSDRITPVFCREFTRVFRSAPMWTWYCACFIVYWQFMRPVGVLSATAEAHIVPTSPSFMGLLEIGAFWWTSHKLFSFLQQFAFWYIRL